MAPRAGRRPHRTRTSDAPQWLQLQRQAIAGYQRRHPGLDYNQVRQQAAYKAAYRTVRRETGKPASKRDAGALASARSVLGLRRAHRRRKAEPPTWLVEYRAAIASYGRKHDIKGPGAYTRIRSIGEFRAAWRDLQSELKKPIDQQDRRPDGRMARALETLGMRAPEDNWDVGDTPTGKVTKGG